MKPEIDWDHNRNFFFFRFLNGFGSIFIFSVPVLFISYLYCSVLELPVLVKWNCRNNGITGNNVGYHGSGLGSGTK